VGLTRVAPSDASRYAVPEIGDRTAAGLREIKRIVEKPPVGAVPSAYACTGRYVLTPEIIELLRGLRPGTGEEVYPTQAFDVCATKSLLYGKILEGTWYDIGTVPLCHRALIEMAAREPS
jgi:UTP--glucose-1-phosphate uridylyltransferase